MLVSIVIPCYNVERYIGKCLASLCRQTHKDIEILCVDDGSTDNTCNIIEKWMNNDARISLEKQMNSFAGVARNNGMKKAKGEYICFLDADDYFADEMIENMLNSALDNNSDIVLCDAYFLDDKTGEITEAPWVLNHKVLSECGSVFSYADIPESIFEVCWSVPWNKLYKKSFIEQSELRFQNIKRHNDEYFVCISLVLAKIISYVDKRYVYYRRNTGVSLQSYSNMQEDNYCFYTALYEIKNELQRLKIYSLLKDCFTDKCMLACVNLIKKQTNYDAYKSFFYFVKNTACNELDISPDMYTKYPSYLNELKLIMQYSSEEYLLQKAFFSDKKKCKYVFPYKSVGNNKRIAIYAAGNVGTEYYMQLIKNNYYHIIAWFDKNYKALCERGLPVIDPEKICNYDFDKIIIAVENEKVYQDIKRQICDWGVNEEKIVWK